MTGMIADLTADAESMAAAAAVGHATATDLADWLVREANLPFREAHHVVGRAVRRADELGIGLAELPLNELRSLDPHLTEETRSLLAPAASAASRTSYGGTAPSQVRTQIARWKERLA